jgi:LPXTG-motif cell wall-anchored protein
MKKKFLSYGVAAVALATGSLFLATPAFADIPLATASTMSVAQGGTFTVTVRNQTPGVVSSNDFCNGETGSGFSMAVLLIGPEVWDYPQGPTGAGFGDFSWDGSDAETASAEITIPADLAPGGYNLILTCRKSGTNAGVSGQGVDGTFTVTAAAPAPDPAPAPAPEALPDTGQDESGTILFAGVGAGVLVALGVTAILVRRRVS